GARGVAGQLEEEALLSAGPGRVLWRVTLPRCRAAVAAAALWVGLQTAGEITVADYMQVRTFAEEAFNEFRWGGEDRLARATAVALPAALVLSLLVAWAVPRLERALPPLQTSPVTPRLFPLGRARLPCLALVLAAAAALFAVPLVSLLWKVGQHGHPPAWSAERAWGYLDKAYEAHAGTVAQSLAFVVVSGL